MNPNLDKSRWTRVALGDVAKASKERVDPTSGEVDRYVAGEHMDTDDLTIHRWGVVGDGYLGPAFHRRFRPGQVLYGSRRTYLRKVAVVDFEGVTANTTFVVETNGTSRLSQRFLPFVMSSEPFHVFSIRESKGSVNPYVNWSDIARYEFDLPPLDEQERLADLLWAVVRHRDSAADRLQASTLARASYVEHFSDRQDAAATSLSATAAITSGVTLGPRRRLTETIAPYLRVANVHRGRLNLDEIKNTGTTQNEITTKSVRRDDVLVVEGHASVKEIGRAAIWDRDESVLFQNHLFRVRTKDGFRSRFILEQINSRIGQAYLQMSAKSTSGLNTINSTDLKALPIPTATLGQQDELLGVLRALDGYTFELNRELKRLGDLYIGLQHYIFGAAL